jgi:hypothetical protein
MGFYSPARTNEGLEIMRNKANATEDRAVTIVPKAPWRLSSVQALDSYCLSVQFLDGLKGQVDLSKLIMGKNAGLFGSLQDPQLFKQVYLKHGVVTWPGELDLAPDAMYDSIKEKGEWILK